VHSKIEYGVLLKTTQKITHVTVKNGVTGTAARKRLYHGIKNHLLIKTPNSNIG
jgi:hypothetical protein